MIFNSEKDCQIEKLFGISVETYTDGKTLVVTDFLIEAKHIYLPKVEKGFQLYKVNGIDVNSYNINTVLQRVSEDPDNPKLTFKFLKEDIHLDAEKLLLMKNGPENSVTQLIKDAKCSVLFISCNNMEYDGNDDKGVLYCYPRPFNHNFLYNTRGAYVTLNHLAPKALKTSEPISSTVISNNTLINVTYLSQFGDLFLLAFPAMKIDIFAAKKITHSIVRILELLCGSLKTCFTKANNIDKLDSLFSRIFATLLFKKENSNSDLPEMKLCKEQCYFEELLATHAVTLPMDVKIQVDDAITELEAADYREWVCINIINTFILSFKNFKL